jgi:hypothetical protein
MKNVSLRILFLIMVVVELYLCGALAPASWQAAVVGAVSRVLPKTFDYTSVTHPALGYEIDEALRRNVGLRVALYSAIILMLGCNTFLLAKIWKYLRPASSDGASDSRNTG